MTLKTICVEYFEAFSKKKLNDLKNLFADDICLHDWEIQAEGMIEVLSAVQKIFDGVKSIKVSPLKLYEDGNTVAAEIKIDIDGPEKSLFVVDVIDFDDEHKISSIRAYRR